jgi:hypothetical protein
MRLYVLNHPRFLLRFPLRAQLPQRLKVATDMFHSPARNAFKRQVSLFNSRIGSALDALSKVIEAMHRVGPESLVMASAPAVFSLSLVAITQRIVRVAESILSSGKNQGILSAGDGAYKAMELVKY